MRKKIIAMTIGMVISLSMLGGCSISKDHTGNTGEADKQIESTNDQTESLIGQSESVNNQGENDEKDSETETLIGYFYQNHPCSITDSLTQALIVKGNHYSIELDEKDSSKYGKLQNELKAFNETERERVTERMKEYQVDILDMMKAGYDSECVVDTEIIPVRADGRVFSFAVFDYSYLGGAHGSVMYYSYNFNPETGEKIKLTDVVKDTQKLPGVIVDELVEQNEELATYFETCPTDKANLLEDIPERIRDDRRPFAWTVDYDGMWFYFEDYAMGCYAAGSQTVKIRFADHPDLFVQEFFDYKEIPDISKQITQKEDDKENALIVEALDGDKGLDSRFEEPFYGIWLSAFTEYEEAMAMVGRLGNYGLDACAVFAPDYENLTTKPMWCVSLGRAASEAEAEENLKVAKKFDFADAYIKYTGERKSYRVYYFVYSIDTLEITPAKVMYKDVHVEDLSETEDNGAEMTLYVDENTVFDDSCAMMYFDGYKSGESPVEWINHADEVALMGVFDVEITGDHIDTIYGTYWWD